MQHRVQERSAWSCTANRTRPAALCREASEAVQHLLTSESPYLHLTAQQPTDPTTNGWVFNLDKYGPDWRKSESYDVTLQDVFD